MVINWSDPPLDPRGLRESTRAWLAVAEALKSRPGEWAQIAESASGSTATNIKTGRLKAFAPGGTFETALRKVSDEPARFDIWARYVGVEAAS